jgi:ATP-binding cassette subfamily C protein CydC
MDLRKRPLFKASVRANIALGRPESSDADVMDAARAARLEDWIDSLPERLDTPIGEQGAQLSGGQRQRLALAPALLPSTPILVLDEPTSGLDEATAERLVKDVISIAETKGLLYVTHRLDELASFDEVVGIENGRVVSPCIT